VVAKIEIARDIVSGEITDFKLYRDSTVFENLNIPTVMSLLTGQDRQDRVLVAATASDVIQMGWDAGPAGGESHRVTIADLHPEDDDRIADPLRPNAYWGRIAPSEELGQGQNTVDIWRPVNGGPNPVGGVATHVIERTNMFEVTWDGTTFNLKVGAPWVIR